MVTWSPSARPSPANCSGVNVLNPVVCEFFVFGNEDCFFVVFPEPGGDLLVGVEVPDFNEESQPFLLGESSGVLLLLLASEGASQLAGSTVFGFTSSVNRYLSVQTKRRMSVNRYLSVQTKRRMSVNRYLSVQTKRRMWNQ
jgi:hypothetical protein